MNGPEHTVEGDAGRSANGRPHDSHHRDLSTEQLRKAHETCHDHSPGNWGVVCEVCGCCWCCESDCCAEYVCANEECGCSMKSRAFREGWGAAIDHLIEYGGPENLLAAEDMRTRFPASGLPPAETGAGR